MALIVRPATLDDVPAITAIHCSDIVLWHSERRLGLAEYAELSTYERWLNGGPWMDEATCAPHLQRWQAHGGLALVAEIEGQVLAEAEASVSDEPAPFGRNLNLSVLYTRRGHSRRGLGSALMRALEAWASAQHCTTLMVTHTEAGAFYAKHGLALAQTWRRMKLATQTSNTRYTAEPLAPDAEYETIRGWSMPIGRYQSAWQEWERLRPGAEPDFEAWRGLRVERWRLTVRRTAAYLILDESPRQRGRANVHVWLPPQHTLTQQHLAVIVDRARRSGFAEVACFMNHMQAPWLGPAAQDDHYEQALWLKPL